MVVIVIIYDLVKGVLIGVLLLVLFFVCKVGCMFDVYVVV